MKGEKAVIRRARQEILGKSPEPPQNFSKRKTEENRCVFFLMKRRRAEKSGESCFRPFEGGVSPRIFLQ